MTGLGTLSHVVLVLFFKELGILEHLKEILLTVNEDAVHEVVLVLGLLQLLTGLEVTEEVVDAVSDLLIVILELVQVGVLRNAQGRWRLVLVLPQELLVGLLQMLFLDHGVVEKLASHVILHEVVLLVFD